MTWGASSSALPWARVASFWLALCFGLVQVPVSGQVMNSGPGLSESSQNELSLLINLSDEQVISLKKRKLELTSLNEQIESFRQSWLEAEKKSMGLSETVSGLRMDLTATSNELSGFKLAFADYKKASEDRAKADQKAIDQARGQLWVWGGAGLGIGLLTGLVIGLIL